jgi:hypothetical protein
MGDAVLESHVDVTKIIRGVGIQFRVDGVRQQLVGGSLFNWRRSSARCRRWLRGSARAGHGESGNGEEGVHPPGDCRKGGRDTASLVDRHSDLLGVTGTIIRAVASRERRRFRT